MAAGLGTRMESDTAKVLHTVAGRPLIVWAVQVARDAGVGRVIAILGHQHEAVKQVLDDRFGENSVDIVLQQEQKGTGHAVMCALPALEAEPDERTVVILSGDAPLLRTERIAQLIDAADCEAGMALLSSCPEDTPAYGRLVRDDTGKLLRIVEHQDCDDDQRGIKEVNAGFYAVRLGNLRADISTLTSDNAKGELYLTDLAARAAERGGAAVSDAPFSEITGINDRAQLALAEAEARRRINTAVLRAGVTMVAPEQVFIDADAGPIGRDVWLGPQVHIRGKTEIGDGARIDAGCVLTDVTVADGAYLKPYSVLTEAKIGVNAQIGPFSHCRPGTRVDEGAKLGNFVETKKAHLMAGAKANHLAYLGDASIGAKANVGAGTITCNYDGFNKHKTTIEAGAFIGSDSQLVAPVTVGRDAYVGSGTTVTKDVPRNALALSRVRQVNKDGWAERFREAQRKRLARNGDK